MHNRLIWILLSTMLQVTNVSLWLMTSMRWVDHITEDPPDMDIFFDRIVMIVSSDPTDSETSVVTTGVLITDDRVLTSFNPFRHDIKIKERRKDFIISVLLERQITDWDMIHYYVKNYSIACARQVIPVANEENLWHGEQETQSPIHDLLVIRLNEPVDHVDPNPSLYSFDLYGKTGKSAMVTGPIITEVAKRFTHLGREIKFASLGFVNLQHMRQHRILRSHTFEAEDNVVVNCDGWIPRAWGRFICISNVENFKGLGSGAMLVVDSKLFGVGSFFLKKGEKSILAFTDVRRYYQLIEQACTVEDQNLEFKI